MGSQARAAHRELLQQHSTISKPVEISRVQRTAAFPLSETGEEDNDTSAGGMWRQAFARFHNDTKFADVQFSFEGRDEKLHGKIPLSQPPPLPLPLVCLFVCLFVVVVFFF